MRLGVNIDHIATLRNARGSIYPSPLDAAKIVESSGAHQITIHLREDRRHIMDNDVIEIIKNAKIDVNLEIGVTDEMIDIALEHKPKFVCLVPENRKERTTESGLSLDSINLQNTINRFHKQNIEVSLFIDPSIDNIKKSKKLNANFIELHTGNYSNSSSDKIVKELDLIKECAKFSKEIGIICNAGHGLNFDNVENIAKIYEINELNIGHSIICEAVFIGLESSIKKMIKIINRCRNY
ncbi:MAG: pyridoxine 5'-phosphate synthase [Pelagibacteraceae bacterium]|nr:pyridoxine 5'-phosphate synthase [Pelagibacteraceae bacterium]|tara:strand:- start:6106 stop:6822 length:717 start_codon:yes stop_codon:yes gene_type:complete